MSRPSRNNAWCRHRTPFDQDKHPVCKAGVDYHQFLGAKTYSPTGSLMPCLGETPEGIERCGQYAPWTADEIAVAETERVARFARMGTIREAIMAEHEATGSNGGQMACPACKVGTVSWSRARSNGHVHAQCSTPGCASWIE